MDHVFYLYVAITVLQMHLTWEIISTKVDIHAMNRPIKNDEIELYKKHQKTALFRLRLHLVSLAIIVVTGSVLHSYGESNILHLIISIFAILMHCLNIHFTEKSMDDKGSFWMKVADKYKLIELSDNISIINKLNNPIFEGYKQVLSGYMKAIDEEDRKVIELDAKWIDKRLKLAFEDLERSEHQAAQRNLIKAGINLNHQGNKISMNK